MKTPTIAELRKLAKQKRCDVEFRTEWGAVTNIYLWGERGQYVLLAFFRKPLARAKRMAFAALSALPDAPKGDKR